MKKVFKRLLPLIIYLAILIVLEIVFWTNLNECGLGFGIISYFMVIPLVIFVISIIYSKMIQSKKKYLLSVIFGCFVMVFEYTTYSLANILAFNKINMPEITTVLIYGVISLIGMLIGNIKIKNKVRE